MFEKRRIGFGEVAMRKLAPEELAVTGTGSEDRDPSESQCDDHLCDNFRISLYGNRCLDLFCSCAANEKNWTYKWR